MSHPLERSADEGQTGYIMTLALKLWKPLPQPNNQMLARMLKATNLPSAPTSRLYRLHCTRHRIGTSYDRPPTLPRQPRRLRYPSSARLRDVCSQAATSPARATQTKTRLYL